MPALLQVESATGPVLFEGVFSEAALDEIAIDDRINDVIRKTSTTVPVSSRRYSSLCK
jgi:hypothetical protein